MRLMIAIVRDVDDEPMMDRLVAHGYRVTRVASTGGFLRRGNATLLIGLEEEQVDAAIALLRGTCSGGEAGPHCATVFVVDAPYFEQI